MNADLGHSIRHTLRMQDGWAQWTAFYSFSRVLGRLSRFNTGSRFPRGSLHKTRVCDALATLVCYDVSVMVDEQLAHLILKRMPGSP
jgi:hypothetical protein